MRNAQDADSQTPGPAAGRSDYATMPVEEAARLLGSGRAHPRAQAPVRRPRQAPARRSRQVRPVPASKTEIQHVSAIIAAAVGELNSEFTVILNATAAAARRLPHGHPSAKLIREAEAATRRAAVKASKLLAFAEWTGAASGQPLRGAVPVEDGAGI